MNVSLQSPSDQERSSAPIETERWFVTVKHRLQAFPRFYQWIAEGLSPALIRGNGYATLRHHLPKEALVVNLGSGTKRLDPAVINLDWAPMAGVDVVGDMTRLPFPDGRLDGLISEAALEHVRDRQAAVAEIQRVLKPGAYLYLVVPFLQGYHAAPDDYYRWTRQGLVAEFTGIEPIQVGVRSGPTSALLWIWQEWAAMALSFNSLWLYRVWWVLLMALTFPLKWLDVLLGRHRMAWKTASSFYYLGVKR